VTAEAGAMDPGRRSRLAKTSMERASVLRFDAFSSSLYMTVIVSACQYFSSSPIIELLAKITGPS
jgi:hypothetical protein